MGANQTNVPVEMIEAEYPIRIERYGFVPDTGGPGRFRGGLSLTREYRLLEGEALLNVRSDKRKHPPHGLFGGRPGGGSTNVLVQAGGERLLPVLLTEPVYMQAGDVFRHVMAGGGGNGDPLTREPALVLDDVLEEKVTPAHADAAYGVVVREGRVDEAATARRRAEMRALAAE
jgi:N-methylhydantoinase B